jgi:CubicO group peptidase (beta-lactamase class C family)
VKVRFPNLRPEPLFSGSFGIADRTFNVLCAEDTRYKIASITKAFTAVLVLQLVEEQKIDLDQPIKHYLSSYYGERADSVKIKMLLNHTSGLPNADAAYELLKRFFERYKRAISFGPFGEPDVMRWGVPIPGTALNDGRTGG